MAKYELLPEQLLYEGTVKDDNFFHPEPLSEEEALRTHTKSYWDKLTELTLSPKEERAIGFPINKHFIWRGRHIANGTIECAKHALESGCALNVAGGTHHAYADHGEGYCCLNDQAVASNYLLSRNLVSKILVVDLDVHQGNGTAHIFQNDDRVFTFSMHGAKNYPLRKEQSNLDVGLPDGIEGKEYLKILRETLPQLMDRVEPEFVFFQSGVDILESDKLGRLKVSREDCRQLRSLCFRNLPEERSACCGKYGRWIFRKTGRYRRSTCKYLPNSPGGLFLRD